MPVLDQCSIYVVEDEPLICKQLRLILADLNVYLCGDSHDPEEAFLEICALGPDIILLDINLGNKMDGIDLARKLMAQGHLHFIYITSYHDAETLERARITLPLAFIIKPFNQAMIESNLQIAIYKIDQQAKLRQEKQSRQPIFFKVGASLVQIKPDQIVYIEAFDNYAYVQTMERRILLPHTLKSIEFKLDSSKFIRVHKSYLANIDKISSIQEGFVYLDSHKVRLGKVYRQKLIDLIQII